MFGTSRTTGASVVTTSPAVFVNVTSIEDFVIVVEFPAEAVNVTVKIEDEEVELNCADPFDGSVEFERTVLLPTMLDVDWMLVVEVTCALLSVVVVCETVC